VCYAWYSIEIESDTDFKDGEFDIKNLRSAVVISLILLLCGTAALSQISCIRYFSERASTHPMSFTDNGNGTVTDNNTGLMWQKQDDGKMYNWYKASGSYDATYNPASQSVCGELTLGGHSDWRLPPKEELITIVDLEIPEPGPKIMTAYFPNTKSNYYWSSTTYAYSPGSAWYVDFYRGYVYYSIMGYERCVRCVRGRQ